MVKLPQYICHREEPHWAYRSSGQKLPLASLSKLRNCLCAVETPQTLLRSSWRHFYTDKLVINLVFYVMNLLVFFLCFCEALCSFYQWKVLFKSMLHTFTYFLIPVHVMQNLSTLSGDNSNLLVHCRASFLHQHLCVYPAAVCRYDSHYWGVLTSNEIPLQAFLPTDDESNSCRDQSRFWRTVCAC